MRQDKNKTDFQKPNVQLYNIPFTTEGFNGMPFRPLGSSGLKVPVIGLGTWKMGYPETGDGSRVDEKVAFSIFDKALETGITFWDTANRYNSASGNSERVIGGWLQNNPGQRRNIIVATKLGGAMDGLTPNHWNLSRGNILDSVYASLDRLQVSYIDLMYFHLFDPHTPVEESLMAIEDLVRQDLIRYFAVSNFTVDQLKAYRAAEEKLSPRCRITAVQNQFDLLQVERAPFKGVLNYAFDAGISFIAWSPLAKGLLTEKYLDITRVGSGDRLYDEGEIKGNTEIPSAEVLHRLAALSADWGMKLNQLVISFMLTLPGMGPVIQASSNVEQLASNAIASKIILTDEQRMKIKSVLTID